MASFPLESNFIVSSKCSRIFSGDPDITVYLEGDVGDERDTKGMFKMYSLLDQTSG